MSEYTNSGKIPSSFINEALESYKTYKADREPLIKRVRDNEAFYRRSYEQLYGGLEETMTCDTP